VKPGTTAARDVDIQTSVSTGLPVAAPLDVRLELNVVLGELKHAPGILDLAASLASGLNARLNVHFAQVVPYTLPLRFPPVPVEFTERSLLELAARHTVDTRANVYLCRDRSETIRQVLKPESFVMVSVERHWWPTFEERLAKLLIQDGHRVLTVNVPKHH